MRAWWGPRPAALQRWVAGDAEFLPKGERYREDRRWYALDRGRRTVDEVLNRMEFVPAVQGIRGNLSPRS